MNEDLRNKIDRLRGLLSSQAQMMGDGVPPMPSLPEAIDIVNQDKTGEGKPISDACVAYKLLNGGDAICPPTKLGACCYFGSCIPGQMETACTGLPGGGGQYQGDGSSCEPNPCGGGMVVSVRDIFMAGLESMQKGSDAAPKAPEDPTMMG